MRPGDSSVAPAFMGVPVIPEHELLRPIASGAYGQVWLARNALGACRAVKIVHRASFEHERPFEREFSGIKAFEPVSRTHEGFVDLLQVGRDDTAGLLYYVMELADDLNRAPSTPATKGSAQFTSEFYEPRTLASELKRRGRLPLEECIQIGLFLTEALGHLHRQGLVHRDIKPSNIIFVEGVPKLADVGLVALASEARSFVGTEGFIAPEGPGTPQADLYSVGIMLYVLSTGKSHQDFPEPPADLASHANHGQWLEFDAVVHKACQAHVGERYRTAGEMNEELAVLKEGQSVKRKRAVLQRWRFAKRFGVAGAAAVLLFAAWQFVKAKSAHIPDLETVRLYEDGQWHYGELTAEHHVTALEKLTQAVQRDPKFIQPYGEMTMVYAWPMLPMITNDQIRLQKIQEIANKTFAVDPNCAEGHMALCWCRFLQRNWRGAEGEIKQALRINPNFALAHDSYCYMLSMQMKPREARREAEWTAKQPPASQRASAIFAACSFVAERRMDAAVEELQKVLHLDPNFAWGYSNLGDYYEAQSNYVAAIEAYRKVAILSGLPPGKVTAWYDAVRLAYDAEGAPGYFRKWIELIRAEEALPENERLPGDLCYPPLVCCYAQLGDKDVAFTELSKHFDEPYVWAQIKYDPRYDSLHGDDRYNELVKRAGLEP